MNELVPNDDVIPAGKASLFPKGIAQIIAGKDHQIDLVDAFLFQGGHGSIHKSRADALVPMGSVHRQYIVFVLLQSVKR